jgi:UDP-N-acetylmuramyl pentapeptide phosphotransferase/UDP-N-acetylglucosamine-1-phosphate transferase
MLRLAAAALVGFLAARLTWLAARPWFAQPALLRPNYRNQLIPTAAGLVFPLALFAVEGGRSVAAAMGVGDDPGIDGPRLLTLLIVSGYCLLGAIDDVAGSGEYRGFRGHLLALAAGRVTTGLFKLVGGAAVALVAVSPLAGESLGRLLADAALVALCANAGNLLDRAPGRAGKVSLLAFAALAVATGADAALSGVAVVAGVAAALLRDDLREHLMLGDAGANPLGAAIGLGLVLTVAPDTRNAVLFGVLALNLLGELVSFSRVIDAVPPLRALDRMGRAAAPPPHR